MNEEGVRSIVALKTITGIGPIADADRIEAAHVGGWTVVVQRGSFEVGEQVLYFEIDAALPLDDPRFAFLEPRGRRVVDGRPVHVLRTAKLRGVYSQGLICKMGEFAAEIAASQVDVEPGPRNFAAFAELLGVAKYEPPLPVASDIVGGWDASMCRRSDAERIQNLAWGPKLAELDWVATEKVDGMSTTFDVGDRGVRIFTRNYRVEVPPDDVRAQIAAELVDAAPGFTIQGELFGTGIQKNPLHVSGVRFAVFGVYRRGASVPRAQWPAWAVERAVPVLDDLSVVDDVDAMLAAVDGLRSTINPQCRAEGVVYARADGVAMSELADRSCFKVISNAYLVKSGAA